MTFVQFTPPMAEQVRNLEEKKKKSHGHLYPEYNSEEKQMTVFGAGVALEKGIHLADLAPSGSLAFVFMPSHRCAGEGHRTS